MEAQKDRKFITFCYVPLIPTSFATIVKCTICNYSEKTTKENLESVKKNEGGKGTGPLQTGYYV